MNLKDPNFRTLFEISPALCVIMSPDSDLRVLAASDAYLKATMTKREEIIGKKIFDIFPDNPDDPSTNGSGNIGASPGPPGWRLRRKILEPTACPDPRGQRES